VSYGQFISVNEINYIYALSPINSLKRVWKCFGEAKMAKAHAVAGNRKGSRLSTPWIP
jgi:hypothetical protein